MRRRPEPGTDTDIFIRARSDRDSDARSHPNADPNGHTRIHRDAGSNPGLLQYYDIYTVRPDGSDLRRLTSDQFSRFPSWTADGRIGFLRVPLEQTRQGIITKNGPRQFWIMDADGGNATQLSVSPQLIDQATWPISWPLLP